MCWGIDGFIICFRRLLLDTITCYDYTIKCPLHTHTGIKEKKKNRKAKIQPRNLSSISDDCHTGDFLPIDPHKDSTRQILKEYTI